MIIEDKAKTFEIEVNGRKMKFAYAFATALVKLDPRWKFRSPITFCVLRRVPANKKETLPIRDFVGQAVFNPHDNTFNQSYANALAFRRACEKCYAAMTAIEPEISLAPTRGGFWDLCRRARWQAEHPATLVVLDKVVADALSVSV